MPRAKTKQVMSVARYIHSKMTPRISPAKPRRSSFDRDVVRILKTKKKLP